MDEWFLYVVRTARGSLYTGIATDVRRRMAEHRGQGGRGARFLRGRGPLRLELSRRIGDRSLALRVEHRFKRLSKRRKEQLLEARPRTRTLLRVLDLAPIGRR